jgi:hypothetical protein
MALEGSLKEFGLADILQLIYFQRKTGILNIEGRMDRVRLLFHEGDVISAESKKRIEANRLGKVLVKKGLINDEDLSKALEEQRVTDIKLGNILSRSGRVEKEQLQEVIISQISETVIQLFNWKEGIYEFSPQGVPLDKEIPINIDTQHLLMEGLRIVDEWALIEGKLTLDTIFEKTGKAGLDLTSDEEEMLGLIDGESDVSTIVDMSQMDNFQASKALVSLIEKGVIKSKEVMPVARLIALPETIEKQAKVKISFTKFITIVTILGSILIAMFSLSFMKNDLRELKTAEDIDNIIFKAKVYRDEHGFYPESVKEIAREIDIWGNWYIYKAEDDNIIVFSIGSDGKEGTEDDIY